jgi:hypothetical protein
MVSRVVSYRVLECDGCAVRFGEKTEASMVEIRARAWVAGWSFPARPGGSDDLCPACTARPKVPEGGCCGQKLCIFDDRGTGQEGPCKSSS